MTGVVLRVSAGTYRVLVGEEVRECVLRGRVKRSGQGSVVVGDRVEIETLEDGTSRITAILPRSTRLARRSFAKRREQVLAANVDLVAIVVSVARPEPDLFLLDRLLVVAELNGIGALVVVNKTDLLDDSRVPGSLQPYEEAGYPVLLVSARAGAGLERLRAELSDRTTVLAGASGVGKSSLLNALVPGVDLRVGDVGDRSGRGRHTTTASRLIPLPGGGFLADTPGVQNFEPAALSADELTAAFRELRPLLGSCRFADCRHRAEPGCSVRLAVEEGRVAPGRYRSYLSLLEAAERAERPWERGGA